MGTRPYETLDLVSGSKQLTPVVRSLAEWRTAMGAGYCPSVATQAVATPPPGNGLTAATPGRIPLGQRKLSLRSSVAKNIPIEMRIPLRGR